MKIRVAHLVALGGLALSASLIPWLARPAPAPSRGVDPDVARDAARAIALLAALRSATEGRAAAAFEAEVADAADWVLDHPAPGFRDDCSGFVSSVFTRIGVPMDGVVATLWDLAVEHDALHWETVPRVGDLAFFDDTWDRDHDGRVDDPLTHVALVLDVADDGVVTFAHAGTSAGRTTGQLDLTRSSVASVDGRRLNTALRRVRRGDPRGTRYLAGELWVGWATVDPRRDWLSPAPFEDEWASDRPDE